MSQHDLLIEIACEELPARFMAPLADALLDGLSNGLKSAGVSFGTSRRFATPRRIAALLQDVASMQPDQAVERRGPAVAAAYRDGQPTKAAEGFARGCGVTVEQLSTIETDKGEYLYYASTQAGLPLAELLQGLFDETLKRMDELVPKRMRWGAGDASFVRPVHSLIALHGDSVLPLQAFGLHADRTTCGHRFHAPDTITLKQAGDYEQALEQAFVLADAASRKAKIRKQVETVAQGRALIDEGLLDEVTALVEWPEPILGRFDEEFLQLPEEVIVTTIQEHQRYFPVYDDKGAISPEFVTVANLRSRDAAQVTAGNEKVVRPRLTDALFFWQQDLKTDVSVWLDKLTKVTYIKGLGSLADKTQRMQALAARLAAAFSVEPTLAARASELAKADLASMAVYEMPELQGIMGGHYARHRGEADAVAQAIAQHYQPEGPDDAIPGAPLGAVTALADKLDTLICLFSQDELRPTSSKDPYGARRAALGVIRILAGFHAQLPLDALIDQAGQDSALHKLGATARDELLKFLRDRLRVWLGAQGFDARIIEAVLSGDQALNVTDSLQRCQALKDMQDNPAFEQLAAANKRIRNILGDNRDLKSNPEALIETAEQALQQALQTSQAPFEQALSARDYVGAMNALAELSAPITQFFDEVLVNAEDDTLRQARHALLEVFARRCSALADFAALSSG